MTIQDFITHLCRHSGIEAEELEVTVDDQAETVTVHIQVPAEESGLLIGFHGETLTAIQRITRVIFQEELGEKRLVVNINEYREQRNEKLTAMAEKAADQVRETGRPYRFAYLPANERFVIHSTIGENPDYSDLESVSEGEGRNRTLIVRLKRAE